MPPLPILSISSNPSIYTWDTKLNFTHLSVLSLTYYSSIYLRQEPIDPCSGVSKSSQRFHSQCWNIFFFVTDQISGTHASYELCIELKNECYIQSAFFLHFKTSCGRSD